MRFLVPVDNIRRDIGRRRAPQHLVLRTADVQYGGVPVLAGVFLHLREHLYLKGPGNRGLFEVGLRRQVFCIVVGGPGARVDLDRKSVV